MYAQTTSADDPFAWIKQVNKAVETAEESKRRMESIKDSLGTSTLLDEHEKD